MGRHGLAVMGHENSALFGRQFQHIRIIKSGKTGGLRCLKVDAWFQT
jgi:hypothetical protein